MELKFDSDSNKDFGLGPGVIASQEIEFKDVPEKDEPGFTQFVLALGRHEEEFRQKLISVVTTEVEEDPPWMNP